MKYATTLQEPFAFATAGFMVLLEVIFFLLALVPVAIISLPLLFISRLLKLQSGKLSV